MPSRSTDRSRTRVEIALRVYYALTWSIVCPHLEYSMPSLGV